MSVPSLNSVHALYRFTFSYPAMNFSSCAVTAVSDMLWCDCTASWDPAHCSFATHHLSHTALSHAIIHTLLCHTPSFTHNFHTHTIFHTKLCHIHHFLCRTPSFTYHFVTHNSSHTTCFISRSSTTSFVLPSPSPLQHVLLILGRSWLVGLSSPLILEHLINNCVCTLLYSLVILDDHFRYFREKVIIGDKNRKVRN